ncbi:hypothetical protein C8J57DRAFT_1335903 [Mycena rebaudengoi]|nr:hypothetical protein C8J57DRAFT_1335903 [Mycena rebaudengoi]
MEWSNPWADEGATATSTSIEQGNREGQQIGRCGEEKERAARSFSTQTRRSAAARHINISASRHLASRYTSLNPSILFAPHSMFLIDVPGTRLLFIVSDSHVAHCSCSIPGMKTPVLSEYFSAYRSGFGAFNFLGRNTHVRGTRVWLLLSPSKSQLCVQFARS